MDQLSHHGLPSLFSTCFLNGIALFHVPGFGNYLRCVLSFNALAQFPERMGSSSYVWGEDISRESKRNNRNLWCSVTMCWKLTSFVYCAAFSCRCYRFWGMDEHSSRRLSKVAYTPCSRPWCLHLSDIYNRVHGRIEEQLHTAMDLFDHVVLHFGGNSCLHSIGVSISSGISSCEMKENYGFLAINWGGAFRSHAGISYSGGILYRTMGRFIITNNGSGHNVAGLRYKEYQLQDYSSWFLKQLNNTRNWKHLKSCLVKSEDCNNLSKKYKTLKQYKIAKLTPIEAGCCRPPSECGYPAVNASYYDLSFHPISSNKDCKLYKNSRAIKCYNCDSCKAGVAQYMKTEWRVVAIFNVVLFVVLSMVYLVGCCARRNATSSRSKA
ncbi:Tetraspanin-10 [Vitis vinifera]|uniref:Tetraspanin-10 n=1 Tax=Vitis vinifera TaxID=29760 RepID=A0A438BYZ5_VITVI|nr:Tetraspanin-10 [Vitis vinifera]